MQAFNGDKPGVEDEAPDAPAQGARLGFMQGQFTGPSDFDRMGEREISELFAANPDAMEPE